MIVGGSSHEEAGGECFSRRTPVHIAEGGLLGEYRMRRSCPIDGSRIVSLLALLLLATSTCAHDRVGPLTAGSHSIVPIPEAEFGNIVWSDATHMFVGVPRSAASDEQGVQEIQLGTSVLMSRLHLPDLDECSRTDYGPIGTDSDGSILIARSCTQSVFETSAPSTWRIFALAQGKSHLVPVTPEIAAGLGEVTVADGGTTFYASPGVITCNTIVVVDEAGLHPFTTSEPGLVPPPTSDGHSDCTAESRAASPTYSSTGGLAFVASPESVGVSDTARLDVPWNIYIQDASGNLHVALEGVQDARGLEWSPDGTRLAFLGTIGGTVGTWVYQPGTSEPIKVAGEGMAIAWSPDGTTLAETQPVDIETLTARLVLVDVRSALTNETAGA
ncbi:MAG TPA: hypothetical protein VGR41_03645 [Actinomycetota bacterium]|nr:hypothetical protein [Actinomycetota bacterium]